MSPRLPVLSGVQLIHALQQLGYVAVRMRHEVDPKRQPLTVPLHDEIAAGTLKRILRDTGLSAEQLSAVL